MNVDYLDHVVLTVADIEKSIAFYVGVLRMEPITFSGRHALRFGRQTINLHQVGHEFEPKATHPIPGSADLCFITNVPIENVVQDCHEQNCPIEIGPVERNGALGRIQSVYLRDPDGNLVEIGNYV